MKTLKTIFATILFGVMFTTSTYAQSKAKLIAVVNQADWCSVCKANGQRAMEVFMENNKDGEIQFVTNDITNAETKKKSAEDLKKVGLETAMKNNKASGVVFFFDAKTKKPITQTTVANSNDEIAYVIGEAKKAVN